MRWGRARPESKVESAVMVYRFSEEGDSGDDEWRLVERRDVIQAILSLLFFFTTMHVSVEESIFQSLSKLFHFGGVGRGKLLFLEPFQAGFLNKSLLGKNVLCVNQRGSQSSIGTGSYNAPNIFIEKCTVLKK